MTPNPNLCRPFCDILVFNQRIKNRIEKMRHKVRGPTVASRRRGYEELHIAMGVRS